MADNSRVLIEFQGQKFFMFVDDFALGASGPIMRPGDYENARDSFAHLYHDGHISRYGTTIGHFSDLKLLSMVGAPEVTEEQTAKNIQTVLERIADVFNNPA